MRMQTRLATHSDVWSEVVSAEKAARSRAGQILLAVAGLKDEDRRRHGYTAVFAALTYYRDCCARLDAAYARGGFEPFDFDGMDWGSDEPDA